MNSRTVNFFINSDSYLKWAVHIASQLPESWNFSFFMVRSPLNPTQRQIDIALQGSRVTSEMINKVTLKQFCTFVEKQTPDIIVFGATGGFIRLCIMRLHKVLGERTPLLATGISGINVMPEYLNVILRAGCHIYIAASHREVHDIENKFQELEIPITTALTWIPYLQNGKRLTTIPNTEIDTVVFTPQPSVPRLEEDRIQLLRHLANLKLRHPELRVYVKLRAIGKEKQTHAELWPFSKLWEEMVLNGEYERDLLIFADGAMQDFLLNENTLLVTVSSTSAIEALDAGCRVAIIDDFGVSRENLNDVFIGSGLVTSLASLSPTFAGIATDEWARNNYFHDAKHNNLTKVFENFLRRKDALELTNFSSLPPLPGEMLFWEGVRANLPKQLSRFLIVAMRPLGRFVKRAGNYVIRRIMMVINPSVASPSYSKIAPTSDSVNSTEP